jgi:hypothetical protein
MDGDRRKDVGSGKKAAHVNKTAKILGVVCAGNIAGEVRSLTKRMSLWSPVEEKHMPGKNA